MIWKIFIHDNFPFLFKAMITNAVSSINVNILLTGKVQLNPQRLRMAPSVTLFLKTLFQLDYGENAYIKNQN